MSYYFYSIGLLVSDYYSREASAMGEKNLRAVSEWQTALAVEENQ